MRWVADPLGGLPPRWRWAAYAWLAVFFARLAIWHGLDHALGAP